ncbi:hypothetical protein QL285_076444 [Trifolium repens]|jgi:hypothetical protein|nr:hypothetical protein QL285_076444 [Trifolium repens]
MRRHRNTLSMEEDYKGGRTHAAVNAALLHSPGRVAPLAERVARVAEKQRCWLLLHHQLQPLIFNSVPVAHEAPNRTCNTRVDKMRVWVIKVNLREREN